MSNNPSDSCRFCKVNFKTKFGKFSEVATKSGSGYSSSVNLFCASKNKDFYGLILSEVCRRVGIVLEQDDAKFSSRVCNPCARKVKNLGQIYAFFTESVSQSQGNTSTPVKNKRPLSSRTPDSATSTPQNRRKVSKVSESPACSRRSLHFGKENDNSLRHFNTDDLRKGELGIKVLIQPASGGNPVVRIPKDKSLNVLSKALYPTIGRQQPTVFFDMKNCQTNFKIV